MKKLLIILLITTYTIHATADNKTKEDITKNVTNENKKANLGGCWLWWC